MGGIRRMCIKALVSCLTVYCCSKMQKFYFNVKEDLSNRYTNIIGHYNPSVRIIDFRDLQFKVDSEC